MQAALLGLRYPKDGGAPTESRGGLAQRWSDRDVRSIDGHDVFTVVDEARRVGVPGCAIRKEGISESRGRELHSALSSMLGWLHRNRIVGANPAAGVHRPQPGSPRDRVLTDAEIKKLWRACETITPPFGAIFRLCLLTGCRLNEVAGMRREELSDDGAWTIPSSRTKNKVTHVSPCRRRRST